MAEYQYHAACPDCTSSDACAVYGDGSTYCFSCRAVGRLGEGEERERVSTEKPSGRPMVSGEYVALPVRRLYAETCRKFDYRTGGGVQAATYYDELGRPAAQKLRKRDKQFVWVGDKAAALPLFGQQLWGGGGKRIVITEGEIDAMSVAQAMNLSWPVVSVPDGAQSAKKALLSQLEYLESFAEVVLMFDNDKPGHDAAAECAQIFSPGKCRIAKIPLKDPNEMLVAGEDKGIWRAVHEASPFRPEGIVAGVDVIDRVLEPPPPSLSYPWECLQPLLRGQRLGELSVWTGGSGLGKSQLVREIAYDLRHRHGEKVGYCGLEESVRKAGTSQVSIHMGMKLHDPDVRAEVPDHAIRAAAEAALDGFYFYENFGSVEADVLLPKLNFMVKALGIRWFILDHISIMVSGTATDGDERKRFDELMTRLATFCEGNEISIHCISHLRKANGTPFEEGGRVSSDDLRGSGSIKQLAHNIVAFERNQQAEDLEERNTGLLRVLKNREFGDTGVAGYVKYDARGRVVEADEPIGDVPALPDSASAPASGERKDDF